MKREEDINEEEEQDEEATNTMRETFRTICRIRTMRTRMTEELKGILNKVGKGKTADNAKTASGLRNTKEDRDEPSISKEGEENGCKNWEEEEQERKESNNLKRIEKTTLCTRAMRKEIETLRIELNKKRRIITKKKNEASSLRRELEENKKGTKHLRRETKRKSEMVESITVENRILRNENEEKNKDRKVT